MSVDSFPTASWSWPGTGFGSTDDSTPCSTPEESNEEYEDLRGAEHRTENDNEDAGESESESEDPDANEHHIPKQETFTPPQPQRVHPPRTCRICLEVVHPTYATPTEGFASMLNFAPRVEYISSEPEAGRLIRPCKCKGSQRYVHEGCLQSWRHADPAYSRRNFWECPTCHFKYRLERMQWSKWISSTVTQIALTIIILFSTVFLLGFVADPIINLYLDPVTTLTSNPLNAPPIESEFLDDDEELTGWAFHIVKGLTSLGLLGFVKVFFAMSPWQAYYWRNAAIGGGGGRNGRAGTGRDRLENISWSLVIIGISTFLWAVWKGVRAWSRRTLQKASDRVVDVQGDDDDEVEEDTDTEPNNGTEGVQS